MVNEFLSRLRANEQAGQPLVWLDAEDYASAVLTNGRPLPWCNSTEFVSTYGRLQTLLKPGVAPLNVGSFLAAWLQNNPAALMNMSGKKRVRYAVKRLLGTEEPRALIQEIVSALCDTLDEPVVLVLPPNDTLINWANQVANQAESAELTDIDIDTASVYLADFLRIFSGLDVAGVLVQMPNGMQVNAESLELYSPIINVAKHYHWAVGLECSAGATVDESVQFLISDTAQSCPTGVAHGESFWSSGSTNFESPNFFYARVPAELAPEAVLARLTGLKG